MTNKYYGGKGIRQFSKKKSVKDKKTIKAFRKETKENYANKDIGEMYYDTWRYNSQALDNDLKTRSKFI